MKKVIIFVIMIIMVFLISSCTYNESNTLTAYYDFENRQCNIVNISKATDYEKLKVTVVLEAKDDFNKEIIFDIGTLNQGDTYQGGLSYISEEIEVSNVYLKSYEYYVDERVIIFLAIILAILFIIGAIVKWLDV